MNGSKKERNRTKSRFGFVLTFQRNLTYKLKLSWRMRSTFFAPKHSNSSLFVPTFYVAFCTYILCLFSLYLHSMTLFCTYIISFLHTYILCLFSLYLHYLFFVPTLSLFFVPTFYVSFLRTYILSFLYLHYLFSSYLHSMSLFIVPTFSASFLLPFTHISLPFFLSLFNDRALSHSIFLSFFNLHFPRHTNQSEVMPLP